MKEFLSMKEFSEFSGVESTTLRYWDEIGLFEPDKRNLENNYRYYTPRQTVAINFIKVLSKLNVPLKAIGEIASVRTPESVMDLIDQQEKYINLELHRLREAYAVIHTRRDLIKQGLRADTSKITVCEMDEQPYILGPPANFNREGDFYEPFMRFCQAAKQLRINLSFPIGGIHDNMLNFLAHPGQPDNFISLDPTGNAGRKAGTYMLGHTRGYYGELGDLHERMKVFAEENGLDFSGPVYSVYLLDEICLKDSSQFLAQVQIHVSKRRD